MFVYIEPVCYAVGDAGKLMNSRVFFPESELRVRYEMVLVDERVESVGYYTLEKFA